MIMVDNSLKIRRFTPLAQDILGLIPTDVGRSIANIRLSIPVKNLEKTIVEVITRLNVVKTTVQDQKGAGMNYESDHTLLKKRRLMAQ